jgi:4-hydroxyproline epimerase
MGGWPETVGNSVKERTVFASENHEGFRRSVILEPRGSDILVGALLLPSNTADFGVAFFNNVGWLGMCGHGTIGLAATLADQGLITPGPTTLETPVGTITFHLAENGDVTLNNVPSFRRTKNLAIEVDGETYVGDVAYGGNWFFLVTSHSFSITLGETESLTHLAWKIRQQVNRTHPEVDHVELFGKPLDPNNDSRNFVLCPGKAYDRSPCGTGTSAKIACLAEDGKLLPGEEWLQESVTGSVFAASYQPGGQWVIPSIRGRAYVTGRGVLILDTSDPLIWGLAP